MTTRDFRSIALGFPEAEERSHFDRPDFRVRGKIFATLGYPRRGWAVAILNPAQQKVFLNLDPDSFLPVNGLWGRRGAICFHLAEVSRNQARKALVLAWRNKAPKSLTRRIYFE